MLAAFWADHHHQHEPLNHEGEWGTTDDITTSVVQFPPCSPPPCGIWRAAAFCPFPSIFFLRLLLSGLSPDPLAPFSDNSTSCHSRHSSDRCWKSSIRPFITYPDALWGASHSTVVDWFVHCCQRAGWRGDNRLLDLWDILVLEAMWKVWGHQMGTDIEPWCAIPDRWPMWVNYRLI